MRPHPKLRIGAVSYLNTVPLVWGMLHGEQRSDVELTFSAPADCAIAMESEQIDVGLVPVAEIARQGLAVISDVGIACEGAVRSILLCASKPLRQIRRLAADCNSRTSVQLARMILRERYGVDDLEIISAAPDREAMLRGADAALIIGDPALCMDPSDCLDLGAEWLSLTGLPMVFAGWAARANIASGAENLYRELFRASYQAGEQAIPQIAASEHRRRGITENLAKHYLSHHIRYRLGSREMEGLKLFRAMSRETVPAFTR